MRASLQVLLTRSGEWCFSPFPACKQLRLPLKSAENTRGL